MIPGDVELVIRTDSSIPALGGIEGDRSLTTVEYFADRGLTSISTSMKIGRAFPKRKMEAHLEIPRSPSDG